MINKYKNSNKEYKEYRASKIRTGTTKTGMPYTSFTIADSKRVNNTWVYENYLVTTFQKDIDLQEEDKIQFLEILAFEAVEDTYNDKKVLKRSIMAEIKVIPSPKHTTQTTIVDSGFSPIGEINSDSLPF